MRRADLLVLSYHAVSASWPAALSVTPERLEEQVDYLVARGYRGLTFDEALRGKHEGRNVVFTFDDGYRSVLTLAAPILARAGMHGTVFVVSDLVGGGEMGWPGIEHWAATEHAEELVSLDWDEIGQLAHAGWEIGSHTRSHKYLTMVDDDVLQDELRGSRAEVELRLGRPCTSLAYPYGDYDARVMAASGEAGYDFACTVPRHRSTPQPLAWPRVGIYHTNGRATSAFKMSTVGRRLRGSPGWAIADSLRRR